jgi:hypothetical protein
MQRPSDLRKSKYAQAGSRQSAHSHKQSYRTQRAHANQSISIPMPGIHRPRVSGSDIRQSQELLIPASPAYTAPSTEMRLPISRRQKFFIALAFILTLGLVTYIPILVIQEYVFPGSNSVTSIVPPGEMGKAILPLTGHIMTGVSLSDQSIDDFEKDSGKKVSLMLSYQAWGSTDGTQYFPTAWANSVRQHGSIPVIAWEPWVTKVYPQGVNEPAYTLKNISAGKFDDYIKQWALAAKDWRGPFFLRFAPEMNGNWTPWSGNVNNNTVGDFVQTWKHVHDVFTSVGATNVTWVWNPNILFQSKGAPPLAAYYPGDAYVDWIAMDGFNLGTVKKDGRWDTFSKLFTASYDAVLTFTTKPMMIAETGCVEQGGNKAAWITDAFSTELPQAFPDIKAVAWFNQNNQGSKQDWRIETSSVAQAAFTAAMKAPVYASNGFANYLGG